jgi:hypothetical protein
MYASSLIFTPNIIVSLYKTDRTGDNSRLIAARLYPKDMIIRTLNDKTPSEFLFTAYLAGLLQTKTVNYTTIQTGTSSSSTPVDITTTSQNY